MWLHKVPTHRIGKKCHQLIIISNIELQRSPTLQFFMTGLYDNFNKNLLSRCEVMS